MSKDLNEPLNNEKTIDDPNNVFTRFIEEPDDSTYIN